jgi:hypothetical protein
VKYRLICLINTSFKIFTGVATNRLNYVADHVISPTQTTFMQGRNILEGVVILHETVHELHRKKQSGGKPQDRFWKTYDKVKWPFLFQTLWMKGFSPKWINWVKTFISGGSIAINEMLMTISGISLKLGKTFDRTILYPHCFLTL